MIMNTFTYTWKPLRCHCYNHMYGHEFVVYMVDFELTAINDQTQAQNTVSGSVGIPYDADNFVDYDTLVATDILLWITNTLSTTEQERFKTLARSSIEHVTIKEIKWT